MFACVRGERAKRWGDLPTAGLQSGNSGEEAQSVLLAWVNNWLAGDCELPQMPSVAFGVSCAWRSWQIRSAGGQLPCGTAVNGDPDDLILKLAGIVPGEKVAKVKVAGIVRSRCDGHGGESVALGGNPDLHLRP